MTSSQEVTNHQEMYSEYKSLTKKISVLDVFTSVLQQIVYKNSQ